MRASRSDLSLSLSLERLPLDVPRPCWSDGPGHCRPADEPITDPLALLTDTEELSFEFRRATVRNATVSGDITHTVE